MITDVVGFGAVSTKLMDVVSNGIGSLWEPHKIKRRADADAYRIKSLSKAETEAEIDKVFIFLENGILPINDNRSYDTDFLMRTATRIKKQAVDGQQNIENIAEFAAKIIPNEVSDDALDQDWTRRFFSYAEDVSDENMQQIWGRILAGEVTTPGTHSLRLLELLRSTSKKSAELFMRLLEIVPDDGCIVYEQGGLDVALAIAGLSNSDLLRLMDEDFVSAQAQLSVKRTTNFAHLSFNNIRLVITADNLNSISWATVSLTTAGLELKKLIGSEVNYKYLKLLDETHKKKDVTIKVVPGGYDATIPTNAVSGFKDLTTFLDDANR